MKYGLITILLPAALAVFLAPVAAAADSPTAIIGVWVTEQKEPGDPYSHVEVYEQDGNFAGRIVWLNEPLYDEDDPEAGQPVRDRENPDETLRAQPLLGLDLMHGFRFDEGDGKWVDGRIYDPENGKQYRCKLTLKDENSLEVFGYVKVGFVKLGRDTIWKRVTTTSD